MFDQLFECPRTVARHSASPLLEERLHYLTHCATQGSTRSSLRLIAQHLLVFIDYLHLETADEIDFEQINTAADLWIGRQPQPHNVTDYRYGRMRFISEAKHWLGFLGRLRLPQVPRRPYTHMIEEFADYASQERGLSRHTIRIRCWYLEQFLDRYWQQDRPFNEISIVDIDAAIADQVQGETTVSGADFQQAVNLEFMGNSLSSDQFGVVFPKDSDLVESVNKVLQDLRAQGVLDTLIARYFGADFNVTYNDIGLGAYGQ